MPIVLNRAARILLARNGVANTTASLIGAHIVSEIVIEGAELVRTVVTHPGAARARRNRELDTVVRRNDADLGIVLMGDSSGRRKEQSKD
jgi:hypothetical protein